jgi:predicted anti-sigma-YlaC factor YlaD
MNQALDDITCRELVELVSDYLEGALSAADRARFEEHLKGCEPCRTYLEQMRLVIEVSGRLSEESLDPEARDALLDAFRSWKRAQG